MSAGPGLTSSAERSSTAWTSQQFVAADDDAVEGHGVVDVGPGR